ncbi:MAG: peptidyl-prolyl cis-trans isomerase SurA, partial [Dokdonia sp.]
MGSSISIAQITEKNKTIDKVIAVVADQIVLQSELETAAIAFARQGNPVEPNTRCVIFEDLLFKKLMMNQAAVDSLEVSDGQINGEISNRIQYFVQQIGSEKKLEEFYGKSIPEIRDEFYDLIKEQMLIQQMQGSITSGVDISPKEVKEFFNKIPEDSLPFVNSEVVVEHIVIDPVVNLDEKTKT